MLSVTMPFSYVASPSTFTSSSLNDIGNRTPFVYLDWSMPVVDSAKWLCQLPFGSYVQDIAYNSEIISFLAKPGRSMVTARSLPSSIMSIAGMTNS
jgi:hypothetical protein